MASMILHAKIPLSFKIAGFLWSRELSIRRLIRSLLRLRRCFAGDAVEELAAAAREKGQVRVEGKDYVMQDGDVVNFRFNV